MSLYIDTSVLAPLFVHEHGTEEARRIVFKVEAQRRVVSDWAVAELASALALKSRLGAIDAIQARAAFDRAGDVLASGRFARVGLARTDFEDAGI